jgi:hypothetical protein
LSGLRTCRALLPERSFTHFCYRLSKPQVHSATGRIRQIEKNSRHRDSNPQPSDLERSASTIYTTAFPVRGLYSFNFTYSCGISDVSNIEKSVIHLDGPATTCRLHLLSVKYVTLRLIRLPRTLYRGLPGCRVLTAISWLYPVALRRQKWLVPLAEETTYLCDLSVMWRVKWEPI